tara:strand:+ start:301 stop:1407 length:1107 start_codon:yes stop_codon:yes gene_type:complete
MKKFKITVKIENQKYKIYIGKKILSDFSKILKENSINFKKCLLVIDKSVPKKIVRKIKISLIKKNFFTHILNANEKNKNQKNIDKILNVLLKENFSRQDCLVAIGGGITGDVAGFAASIFKRGIQFINVPTTLLSQVDSSIGGKTGINTKHGKNLIGSFYQPKLVISDIEFLETLPIREIICGYGEILKHSLISNKSFYTFLGNNIENILKLKSPYIEKTIYESCKIKKSVVEKDEKEKNLRKILNFGHTFAHSYEASLGYSKKLNHGEAVLLGMNTALKFSFYKKLIREKEYHLIKHHLQNKKFPNNINKFFSSKDINKIISFMLIDKKNTSKKIKLILLKKIGTPILNKSFNVSELKTFFKRELIN